MSIFDSYNSEFATLNQEIQKYVGDLKEMDTSSIGVSPLVSQIENLVSQAQDVLKQMEVEARGSDAATRKVLGEKVSISKKALSNSKIDFERMKEKLERSSLIGSRSGSDRQRFMDTQDKLERQNDMIDNARRTVAETEEVGLEITSELSRNREKIDSSREQVYDFSVVTDGARRILSSMNSREVRQKWLIAFVVVVLVIAFSCAIYYGTQNKK